MRQCGVPVLRVLDNSAYAIADPSAHCCANTCAHTPVLSHDFVCL